jgi:hypothetical protein
VLLFGGSTDSAMPCAPVIDSMGPPFGILRFQIEKWNRSLPRVRVGRPLFHSVYLAGRVTFRGKHLLSS